MEDIFILIAEDDADDRFLLQAAFEENGFTEKLEFVENGVEVLDYLHNLSGTKSTSYLPSFILMDLNMPKKDGREVLKELKESPGLRMIPVIVFSTTSNEQEKKRCYELGANGYITKPTSFEALMQTVADLRNDWINVGTMPMS
ncbi:response regulator [Taibaiella soli]|uniref:Response regulator n=1 Tax=Taibaiella soli TaxID=1649169 RepID=A0A2W2C4B0_9BACT|nr:response regulator [Taibaiella soli]PZF74973.1 response regulator [Taibaiella soli]